MEEYFEDTIVRRRDFRAVGLHYYKNDSIIRLPIENYIGELLYRFPYDYYNEFIDFYFNAETKKELNKNKINNFVSLLNYCK